MYNFFDVMCYSRENEADYILLDYLAVESTREFKHSLFSSPALSYTTHQGPQEGRLTVIFLFNQ